MVFPNGKQPLHGIFVLERVKHLAMLADVHVVAPIPWFRAFGEQGSPTPMDPILSIRHPRFWYTPKLFKYLRGFFLFASTLREIAKLRRRFDFDLIDAHFAYPDGFAAILFGLWFDRPVCITLRGTIGQWSQRAIGRWICDWTMRRADGIIAVAESLAERARQGQVGENRIATIPNGIDTGRFRLLGISEARKRLDLPQEARIFVSIGHISPRKGFHRVIRSFPRVLKSYPDARLVIVGGKGAEEDNTLALHDLVQRLGLVGRVSFVGPQTPDEIAVWLGAANIFVLASDFEGCPNVVLEAMACGRPVVATKVGDIERMVPDFAGILFDDPEDEAKLAECMAAALMRDWQAERIRAHVASRSWKDVAHQVLAHLQATRKAFAVRVGHRPNDLAQNAFPAIADKRD